MNLDRLNLLLQLSVDSPNDAFTQFALAKEYEKLQDWAKALSQYEHLRQLDPNYVGLYYHLGKLYERLDRLPDAIGAYKQGMEVAKLANDRHAWSELSAAKMDIDDSDD
jgi:tetratricopeptide (TPR) repeat protein